MLFGEIAEDTDCLWTHNFDKGVGQNWSPTDRRRGRVEAAIQG